MKIKCPKCGRYTDANNDLCYWCNSQLYAKAEPSNKSGNMFVDAAVHRSANDIDDCLKSGSVVQNLWLWAQRLERFGKILMIVLLIIGTIYIIDAGITANEHINGKEFETFRVEYFNATGEYVPTIFEAVIDAIFHWGIICFIVYCTYHALALLIGAVASITHNTSVTARLAEYTARRTIEASEATQEDDKLPEL